MGPNRYVAIKLPARLLIDMLQCFLMKFMTQFLAVRKLIIKLPLPTNVPISIKTLIRIIAFSLLSTTTSTHDYM